MTKHAYFCSPFLLDQVWLRIITSPFKKNWDVLKVSDMNTLADSLFIQRQDLPIIGVLSPSCQLFDNWLYMTDQIAAILLDFLKFDFLYVSVALCNKDILIRTFFSTTFFGMMDWDKLDKPLFVSSKLDVCDFYCLSKKNKQELVYLFPCVSFGNK